MAVLVATSLTFDFIACAFVASLIAAVLLTGWITRSPAVIVVATMLSVLAMVLGGLWFAYRFESLDGPTDFETSTVRLVAGIFAALIVGAVWALFRMLLDGRFRSQIPPSTPPRQASVGTPQPVSYDHAWLLSLLQQRVAASREKIAITTPPSGEPQWRQPENNGSNSFP